MHPKDWGHPGRIKVELYDEMGNPKNNDILTKKALMHKIVEILPRLATRKNQPPLSAIDEALTK